VGESDSGSTVSSATPWISHSHSSAVRAADRTLGSEAIDPTSSSLSNLPRGTPVNDRTVSLVGVADSSSSQPSVKLTRLNLVYGSTTYDVTWPTLEPCGGLIDSLVRHLRLTPGNGTTLELRKRNPGTTAASTSYLPIPRYSSPLQAGLRDHDTVYLFVLPAI
jgi:hypothetical protein